MLYSEGVQTLGITLYSEGVPTLGSHLKTSIYTDLCANSFKILWNMYTYMYNYMLIHFVIKSFYLAPTLVW